MNVKVCLFFCVPPPEFDEKRGETRLDAFSKEQSGLGFWGFAHIKLTDQHHTLLPRERYVADVDLTP
jgi:hypothetical protein